MSTYNSYHTNLVLLYKFNALPEEFKPLIPNSTLKNWKNRDTSEIIGVDAIADKDMDLLRQLVSSRKLLKTAKLQKYTMFAFGANTFIHAN